ncbi:MAG: hypothetical protein NC548_50970 [Lachnospiraceae bacterium]|nr:hypothetical protein [Lachnospiraceae bacterium]
MIEVKIRHRHCKMHLILQDKITVIMGESGTGKSTIHKAQLLKDALSYTKISDNRFQMLYISGKSVLNGLLTEKNILKPYFIYVIDEGYLDIDDDVASVIKRSINCYFIITSRGGLGKINFDIKAVKELVTKDNGVTILKDYIQTTKQTKYDVANTSLQFILIEDKGKAKTWFEKLFITLDTDIKSVEKGKDAICDTLNDWLNNNSGNILAIFDTCSFGGNVKKFKGIVDKHGSRVLLIYKYKSWEYLILNSNMFKQQFIPYDINISEFEEAYYEELLKDISSIGGLDGKHVYTTIDHDSRSKLSRCYTEKCCAYSNKDGNKCNYGLSGEDKFIALLKDTMFEDLLITARRI